MSVYNGAESLPRTLESVLTQDDVDLELIVIDDGSTDGTGDVLEGYGSSDRRIVPVREKDNLGLTRRLISGCRKARGRYIARQDCGDISLPGRFSMQERMLDLNPDAAFVSCGTRFVEPGGGLLYEVAQTPEESRRGLSASNVNEIRGPIHVSTMFRKDAYDAVGGYREEFYAAQDLDLWLRMKDRGDHLPNPDIYYEAVWHPQSISGYGKELQQALAGLAIDCEMKRRQGENETELLNQAKTLSEGFRHGFANRSDPSGESASLYFIASQLRHSNLALARRYFWRAFRKYPYSPRPLIAIIGTYRGFA